MSLPEDFDGIVRLFPLPDLVLFPGCVQPLHIFESRYCEMFEDAVSSDQLISLATLLPGYEPDYVSRPPIDQHTCVGRVIMHDKTPQGTYNLVLIGVSRARIKSEITPVRSYRRAHVELLSDLEIVEAQGTAHRIGVELAERLTAEIESTQKVLANFRDGKIKLGTLTDLVAFHVELSMETRLQLLAELDPIERAHVLLQAIDQRPSETVATDVTFSKPTKPRGVFPPPFGKN